MSALPTYVRRFCKAVLRQYPLFKQELAALEEEKKAVAESLPVATWREAASRQAIGDPTSRQAFRLLRLEERWRQVRFYVQAVEDLLAYLSEERRRLVELHFFDGLPPWQVAQELSMSESNFYRYEKEVLVLLAHRLGL